MKSIAIILTVAASATSWSAQVPAPSAADSRVRYVTYSKDDVTTIFVQRGTATRIILEEDERILTDGAATGFAADCATRDFEWCISADVGSSQILIKPKDGATHNNLELRTNKRDYSFDFRVLPNARASNRPSSITALSPMHRVIFRYQSEPSRSAGSHGAPSANGGTDTVLRRLAPSVPRPRNWRYSMQAMPGSSDIVPSVAFDDGRFTYFKFPANREIPTIFFVSPSGEEGRVNFHVDHVDSSVLVVERLARRFVLRLGHATVGIWNDAFDAAGSAPVAGTTVPGVVRDLRQGDRR